MIRDRLKTTVVGAGYVGIATAVGLAEQGRDIVRVEQDPDRLAALEDGRVPFHEPELPEAYAAQHASGRIVPSAVIPGDGLDFVVCVGTPIDDTGSTDVSYVSRALDQSIPAITAGAACVIRSTLPMGSAARLASRPSVPPEHVFVAPEFLRQGRALGARLDAHFDERAQLDLEYIDHWSLALDIKNILQTVPAVVGGTGK